jgi:ABC-type sugar transport system substrate-binding protein
MIKKVAVTSAVALLLASLAACGNASGSGGSVKSVSVVLGAVADPYWHQSRCGAEAEGKQLGISIDWQGPAGVDIPAQLQALTAVVQKRPAAIVLVPQDPNAFVAPVRQAIAQGIPVLTLDGKLAQPVDLQNIRTDGAAAGAKAADLLGAQLNGQGTVIVQGALTGVPTLAARVDGFKAEMAAKYPGITVLPTQYSFGKGDAAATSTESLIRANSSVNGVYTIVSGDVAQTAAGLTAAGKLGQVKWIAWDATEVDRKYLQDGTIEALIAQDPAGQSALAVKTAYEVATGKADKSALPKEVLRPATVITRENLDDPEIKALYEASC